jgi:hypothetical protein
VLGAAMLSPAALVKIRDLLDGAEFYRPGHQVICRPSPHSPTAATRTTRFQSAPTSGQARGSRQPTPR